MEGVCVRTNRLYIWIQPHSEEREPIRKGPTNTGHKGKAKPEKEHPCAGIEILRGACECELGNQIGNVYFREQNLKDEMQVQMQTSEPKHARWSSDTQEESASAEVCREI